MAQEPLNFTAVDHALLRRRVVDTRSLREGVLVAVLAEDGRRVAYVRGDDHLEFTAPADCLRAAR
ncbi:hypothetical protein [Streptomyces sp. NPDC089919]|uniref:hypothetical protein n=1 Tax=Streptomyces sp. NPDC089919 TaxID=3155188 RepID=UPI003438136B